MPEMLDFAQKTHSNQADLDQLLGSIKLKFWLPLQHIRFELMSLDNTGNPTSVPATKQQIE